MIIKKLASILLLAVAIMASIPAAAQKNIYGFSAQNGEGQTVSMKAFKGKVLLVINTATECGFTPQYTAIEQLYEKYKAEGFEVLDFPCNQFGNQAPGSFSAINRFCTERYNTQFPRFEKVEVNGDNAHQLWTYLKAKQPFAGFGEGQTAKFMDEMLRKKDADYDKNSDVKWNFTKFLVDRRGRVIARFEPTADMGEVEQAVAKALKGK